MSLYRTHRPASFDDVVGQDHVISVLKAALAQKKTAHGYLFSGTRGLGKTTIARIFAKELGCSPEDLYEIDGASNRGIDDIRELRSSVGTAPLSSPFKVYLIDEVHMLTIQAFNALLKTLEEPPAHVIFMMATTEPHKIPDTILSRVQRFDLSTATLESTMALLERVSAKEEITCGEGVLKLIAKEARGSFRDSLSILEKVIVLSEDSKLGLSEVETVLGIPSHVSAMSLVEAFAAKDLERALSVLLELKKKGLPLNSLFEMVAERMRVILMLRFAPIFAKENMQAEFTAEEFATFERLKTVEGKEINAALVFKTLSLLNKLPSASLPYLLCEVFLIENLKKGE